MGVCGGGVAAGLGRDAAACAIFARCRTRAGSSRHLPCNMDAMSSSLMRSSVTSGSSVSWCFQLFCLRFFGIMDLANVPAWRVESCFGLVFVQWLPLVMTCAALCVTKSKRDNLSRASMSCFRPSSRQVLASGTCGRCEPSSCGHCVVSFSREADTTSNRAA